MAQDVPPVKGMAPQTRDAHEPLRQADQTGKGQMRLFAGRRWRGVLLVLALMILGTLVVLRWGGPAAEKRALERMPPAERAALYEKTLRGAESLCAQAGADDALRDRCADSASFLLLFPECDDACRALARTHRREPTR